MALIYDKRYTRADETDYIPIKLSATVTCGQPVDIAGALCSSSDTYVGVCLEDGVSGDWRKICARDQAIVPVKIGASQAVTVGALLAIATGDFALAISGEQSVAIALEAVTTGGTDSAIIPARLVKTKMV